VRVLFEGLEMLGILAVWLREDGESVRFIELLVFSTPEVRKSFC
jgi:hypothetical protein